MIKMLELKECLESSGFTNVRTYIQSGNVLFSSNEIDTWGLSEKIKASVEKRFKMQIGVVVFSKMEWQTILKNAPKDWGGDKNWKHNLLVLLKPYDMLQATMAIGELKPGIEALATGEGVLYQSISVKMYGRTTTGKLASNPIYKKMTVRNYNTSVNLLSIFDNS